MKTEITTAYAQQADMTFILLETYENSEITSTEVVGFYFGEPNDDSTQHYIGKLKAEF